MIWHGGSRHKRKNRDVLESCSNALHKKKASAKETHKFPDRRKSFIMIWMIRHNPPAARRATLTLCNSRICSDWKSSSSSFLSSLLHSRARESYECIVVDIESLRNARGAHETRQINWLFIFYQIILFVVGLSTERKSEGKLHMENCILSANDRDIVELARSSLSPCAVFFSSSSCE